MPILIEAKSAGDFTNTNKRRKEEATKVHQLRATYGLTVRFVSTVREGGWDPAAQYRTFEEQIGRLTSQP